MSKAPPALLILGMHRSGTSALARLLATLGVDFGSGHLPAGPANELGFFEKAEVADANERLLLALGLRDATDPRPLPADWLAHPACEAARNDLVSILASDLGDAPILGVKDPRICRLVPLWKQVMEALGREPSFVHITRSPLEVAASLAARQGLPARTAHLSWLRHGLESELATRGERRVFVAYDALLEDWRPVADRIASELALEWPVPPDTVHPELPTRLRHHRCDDEASIEAAGRWIASTWRGLRARAGEGGQAPATRRLDAVRRELAAADELGAGEHDAPAAPAGESPARYAAKLRWDHGQLDARGNLGELVARQAAYFQLEPRHGGFCGVDLLFGTYARSNTSTLDVELRAVGDGEPRVVERWELAAAEIENDAWRAFRFAPEPESRGRLYEIELVSRDAEPGDAVTAYCSPEGAVAYRAYFAELVAEPELEPSEAARDDASTLRAELGELALRLRALESEAGVRDARSDRLEAALEEVRSEMRPLADETLPQVVAWSGRVPGLEERVGSLELEGARRDDLGGLRSELEARPRRDELEALRGTLESLASDTPRQSEIAAVREELLAQVEARTTGLEAELRSTIGELREQLADARVGAEREAERLRGEIAEQRARIEPVTEQLQLLRELHAAAREAGDRSRREQDERLTEAEARLREDVASLRAEEASLREALEETHRARSARLEERLRDDVALRRGEDAAREDRTARLEALVLETAERVDALGRRTDRDLAAIGDALEEAWG